MSLGPARHLGQDIWFRYLAPSCLTQGVALDRNSFLGDTENDVWPKLNWLPPSVVLGKCSFILPPKNRIHVSVFQSSQSRSLYHDLCLDSVFKSSQSQRLYHDLSLVRWYAFLSRTALDQKAYHLTLLKTWLFGSEAAQTKRSIFEQSQVIRKMISSPNYLDCPHWLVSQVLEIDFRSGVVFVWVPILT